jgi:hypothetical protein
MIIIQLLLNPLNKNILIQETSNIFQIRATIEAIESGS